MTACKHAYYSGRVQGVGFRYTAQRLADKFKILGYVRNLPTGDVELVAQGQAEDVDAFLQAVAQRMAGYIDQANVQDEEPAGHYGFNIRY